MSVVFNGIGTRLAKSKALGPVLDAVAAEVEKAMLFQAAQHIDTSDYAQSIEVTVLKGQQSPSGQDRYVAPHDPAAIPIEYGWTDKQGNVHDGQHIMAKTVASIPGV